MADTFTLGKKSSERNEIEKQPAAERWVKDGRGEPIASSWTSFGFVHT